MRFNKSKLADGLLRYQVFLDASELRIYEKQAQEYYAVQLDLHGFRKGHAPLNFVRDRLDNTVVQEEAGRRAIERSFLKLIAEEDLDVHSVDAIEVLRNTPAEFAFSLSLLCYPRVQLGAYRGLRITRMQVLVRDAEVQYVLADIIKLRQEQKDAAELDDNWAKSVGKFNSLPELKISIRQGLLQEKKLKEQQRVRLALLKEIRSRTKIQIPKKMQQDAFNQKMEALQDDLAKHNITLAEYLSQHNTTEKKFFLTLKSQIHEGLVNAMILREIARREQINVSIQEIGEYTDLVLGQKLAKNSAKNRVQEFLLQEKVFNFLEAHAVFE